VTNLVLLVFATFFVWETLRYALENFASGVFSATRVLHPLLVAALPLYVLWPDWVSALGVAGLTGVVVALADRLFSTPAATPLPIPRRRSTGGLPPLP
jgi:hypothetical protein